MHPSLRTSLLIAALLAPCPNGAKASSRGPYGGMGVITAPAEADGRGAGLAPAPLPAAGRASTPASSARADFVPLAWPLERTLGNGLMIVNHVDLDPSAGLRDFMGGTWTYDGHAGTDIQLGDFRQMDRGLRVLAAQAGTVLYLSDSSPYDRHCDFNWPDGGNWVWLVAADGSYHEYYHLRRSSIVVKLGESVQQGQMIGLVGSSGYATGPHLHFETGDDSGPSGSYRFRDPFHGPAQPLPSLWTAQPDYGGSGGMRFFGAGVFTEAQTSGSIYNTSYCDMMNTLAPPAVYGRDQQKLCMWFQYQSPAGDSAIVRVRRPDGSVYGEFPFVSGNEEHYGWFWSWFYLAPYTTAADDGLWRLQLVVHGTLQRETVFMVGPATVYGPRFAPRGGRSFRLDGSTQRDTLRRDPLGPPVTYALLDAPSAVTLMQDSILVVAGTSPQPTRSQYFRVTMTDASARRDTAWYHIVDLTKPMDPPTTEVAEPAAAARLALAVSPQPSRDATRIAFTLARASSVRLTVLDLAGRRVGMLANGPMTEGPHEISWDGRDAHGTRVGAGIYFARLETPDGMRVARVVRLK